MRLSIKPAALLVALFMASGALAQDWEDQVNWGAPRRSSDLFFPDNPPCLDGAYAGTLRRTGETGTVEHNSVRTTVRWFELIPHRTLFGPAAPASIRFPVRAQISIPDRDNAVLLVRKKADGTLEIRHGDLFVRDRRGREFIPIVWVPTGSPPSARINATGRTRALPIRGPTARARSAFFQAGRNQPHLEESTT